jgi:hypothetical protein
VAGLAAPVEREGEGLGGIDLVIVCRFYCYVLCTRGFKVGHAAGCDSGKG